MYLFSCLMMIQLKPVPGAREALMKLSEKYRIILISGRDEVWDGRVV